MCCVLCVVCCVCCVLFDQILSVAMYAQALRNKQWSIIKDICFPMSTPERVQELLDRIQNMIDWRNQFVLNEAKDKTEEIAAGPERWPTFLKALQEDDVVTLKLLNERKDKFEKEFDALKARREELRDIERAIKINRYRLEKAKARLEAIRVPPGESRSELIEMAKDHRKEELINFTVHIMRKQLDERVYALYKECDEAMVSMCFEPAAKMLAQVKRETSDYFKNEIGDISKAGAAAAGAYALDYGQDRGGKRGGGRGGGEPWPASRWQRGGEPWPANRGGPGRGKGEKGGKDHQGDGGKGKGGDGKGKSAKGERRVGPCWRCGRPGHLARDCHAILAPVQEEPEIEHALGG